MKRSISLDKRTIWVGILSGVLYLFWIFITFLKVRNLKQFGWDMDAQPLPNSWTPFLIWGLSILHIAIAISLIADRTRLMGVYATFTLLSIYIIYIVLVKSKVLGPVPCSCTWIHKSFSYGQTVLFNLCFLILSGITIRLIKHKPILIIKPFMWLKHKLSPGT